jgi:hypothetical protein
VLIFLARYIVWRAPGEPERVRCILGFHEHSLRTGAFARNLSVSTARRADFREEGCSGAASLGFNAVCEHIHGLLHRVTATMQDGLERE